MKTFLRILTLVLLTNYCNAQFSNNIWCFGDSAGLDFSNATNPLPFMSAVNSRGSCVSIADSSNQLLFYAFTRATLWGPTTLVYNANNQVMQNGDSIVGEGWYQELVIVPDPSNTALFYLFSISITGSSGGGLYYSKIDMSQNGGLGAVMQKNIPLDSFQANDGIIAVKHANGRDWWLFYTYYWNNPNNNFHVYLISPTGIGAPIMQSVGTINPGNNLTHFTFSKNGNQFSMVNNISQIDLFDFDRCNGIITHHVSISAPDPTPPWHNYQGSAFSPSGQYLYVADFDTISRLFQFDLLSANIPASKTLIDSFTTPEFCGGFLKLAPDNKIYMSNAYNDGINFNYPYADTVYNMYNMNLSVINQPDSAGLACNFTKYSFYLGGNRTYWGLPNNPDYTLGPVVGSVCDTLTSSPPAPKGGDLAMQVYPNPVSEKLNIESDLIFGDAEICIYNLLGEKCFASKAKNATTKITLDIAALKQGLYLLQLKTNSKVWSKKFFKE